MKSRYWLLIGLCGWLFSAVVNVPMALASAPAPEAFIPEFRSVQISPDGELVATIRPFDGRTAIVIYRADAPPAGGNQPVSVIPSGDGVDVQALAWANDERLLVQVGYAYQNVDQWYQFDYNTLGSRLIAINADGSNPLVIGAFTFSWLVSMMDGDRENILFQRWENGRWRVYEFNIYSGDRDRQNTGRRGEGFYTADASGEIRGLLEWRGDDFSVFWRNPANGGWRRMLRHHYQDDSGEGLGLLGFGNSGGNVIIASNHEGRYGIYRISPQESTAMERVFLHDRVDAYTYGAERGTGNPLYVTYIDDLTRRHYLDAEYEAFESAIGEALPGEFDYVTSSDRSNQHHVVTSFGAGVPVTYYLYDRDRNEHSLFAPSYPLLSHDDLSTILALRYQARDGLEIPAYLAIPKGVNESEPLPLVVMPHGGPFARDTQHYNSLRQFISTRGYLVFTPNFRGSTGYGNQFQQAGWSEWGRGMLDDVFDGVRHLIREGIADPDRICIAGWSYGAYAALQSAALDSDLFQCAIGVNGVYDIQQTRNPRSARYWDIVGGDWDQFIGSAQYSSDAMRAMSPRYRADRIEVPVLLIASAQDPVARIAQSEDMAQALADAGVPYQTRFFDEGNHSMNYGPSMIETYEIIERFLDQHLH